MLGKTWRRTLWLVFVGITLSTPVFGQEELPRLEQTEFDPHGRNETLLYIGVPGRYSLQAQSDQGTKIEIVDRMAGPFAAAGIAGEWDGRLDLLLDKGTYKIRLRSHEEGVGTLKLAVHPFVEIGSSDKLLSIEAYQIKSSSLEDLQQRSFWLHLKKRRILRLEAIGRNLKDCRLWRDGVWLEDIKPHFSTYEPVNGQPMRYAEFYHDLNPGVYRLTFYGGAAMAWSDDSGAYPFSLRMGYRRLGSSGKQIITLSPFGRDAYVVPAETDFFQISRADKKATRLSVSRWNEKASRHGGWDSAAITKESRNPWAVVQTREERRDKWVTVQGNPGDRVVLTYFPDKRWFSIESGDYWISSLHSAEGQDLIDVTGVISHPEQKIPVEAQVLPVGLNTPLVTGKFNLLGDADLFLRLEDAGTYVIEEDEASGARGRYRIEPFIVRPPRNYRSPPFELPGKALELTQGFYKLTIRDESKGILSFVLRQKDRGVVDSQADSPTRKQSLLLPSVTLPHPHVPYTLQLNHRHNVATGVIVRSLPMDLSDPLPVILNPGQSVPVSIRVSQRSTLVVERDKETAFLLNAGERRLTADSILSPGSHTLSLKNSGTETALFTLKTIPAEPSSELTLRDLKDQLEQPKSFPQLTEEQPLYANFDRNQKQHFTLIVKEPSLYRLETSGRLATQLTVRTALITQLFTEKQNGIGRNALVQQYLRPGVYQITVQTQGQSRGRAGIHLRRTSLRLEEGPTVGGIKKAHLQPDVALRYTLTIDEPGRYHLQTLSLGKDFAYRLEDEEEWPLSKPGRGRVVLQPSEPKVYHYYSLPSPVESTRITALTRIAEKQERVGKGPHPISFNETVKMMWREEEGRLPDILTTEITAPVDVTINLSGGMAGVIRLQGKTGAGRTVTGGSAWKDTLQPGEYEIAVKSAKENNLLPYTLRMETSQLIPGLRQSVDLPADLTVRLGEPGIVDLFSFGPTDVKASLWDETGTRLLAQNDDMPNDWNFRISQRLAAGRYLLKLVPVGQDYDMIHVFMEFREQRVLPERDLPPFTVEEDLEERVLAVPFRVDNTGSLVGVTVNASRLPTENGVGELGVALLKDARTLYEGKVSDTGASTFYIPLQAETLYQILVWGLGDFRGEVMLDVVPLEVKPVTVLPKQTELLWPPYAEPIALELTDANQSSYKAHESTGAPLYFSSTLERSFEAVIEDTPVVMNEGRGWLILSPYEQTQHLTLEPFALEIGTVKTIQLRQLPFAFDLENENDGPLLLEVNSIEGEIGAMTYTPESQFGSEFHWRGLAMGPSKTVVAVPSRGKYRAKIWQTRKTIESEKVHLSTHPLRMEERIQFGRTRAYEGPIKPGSAKVFVLDRSRQTYELLLTKGLVAFVWDGKHTSALVAARSNTQELVTVSGGELFIVNHGDNAGLFRIERKREIAETVQDFDSKKGFEGIFTEAGTVSLLIEEGKDRKELFVAGDTVRSRLLGNDGIIREGERFQPNRTPGILEISYDPGYVKVWEANPQEKDLVFMGKKPRRVKGLSDERAKLENRSQRWMFDLKRPAYIIADADGPGVTALLSDQKVLATSVGSSNKGRQLRYFLPPGDYQLWTRPLEGTTQAGKIRLLKVFPKPLDTAFDSPRLIRPGEIQAFTFNVTVKGKVGVGIRTESDQLDARLFDSQFNRLASSPVMIQELELGEYLLMVETVPQASGPIQYTPLVLGHAGGRLEIPEEVIDKYLTQTIGDD